MGQERHAADVDCTCACCNWIVMYPGLPDQLASHFDLNGSANGHMSKPFFIIFMSLLNLVLVIFIKVIPRLIQKRANYAKFMDVYELLCFIIAATTFR
jgi:uncharacterized membrane protein